LHIVYLPVSILRFQHQERRQAIEAYLAKQSDREPSERLLSVFDWLGVWFTEQGTRGCAFLNAAAELVNPEDESARQVVRQHKQWWRELLTDLARNSGVDDSLSLADDLLLLIDGVSARVLVTGDASVTSSARQAAGILLREYRTGCVSSREEMAFGPPSSRHALENSEN